MTQYGVGINLTRGDALRCTDPGWLRLSFAYQVNTSVRGGGMTDDSDISTPLALDHSPPPTSNPSSVHLQPRLNSTHFSQEVDVVSRLVRRLSSFLQAMKDVNAA